MVFLSLWKAVINYKAIATPRTMSNSVFSICIPKAAPIDWREVKQLWYTRFPDDEVEQVDVVPYKSDHALAGYVKIFVHWHPRSDEAFRMRAYCERNDKNEYLVNGPMWHGGVEKWACSRSRVARKERKPKEASDVAETVMEYAEPYTEVPPPPPPPPSTPATQDAI
jgi:hypothetical protein